MKGIYITEEGKQWLKEQIGTNRDIWEKEFRRDVASRLVGVAGAFKKILEEATPIQCLAFEQWLELNEEDIAIELAESGADRELDFDLESEQLKRYEIHVNNNLKKS